jgi:hypothetical protein
MEREGDLEYEVLTAKNAREGKSACAYLSCFVDHFPQTMRPKAHIPI